MKRFFLGKFSNAPAKGSAQSRALAVVSACLGDAKILKATYNEAVAKGLRGDDFAWDFSVEVWLGEQDRSFDAKKAVAAALEVGIDPKLSRTFLADEKIIKEGSAPIKGTFLSRRKPGTTVKEYLSYWRGNHADVILAQKDFYSFVRRYVQNHFVEGSYQSLEGELIPQEDAFDGSPQMWFDSVEDIFKAFQTVGYTRFIRDDEQKFLKFGHSQSFIAREHEMSLPLPPA